jgi:hypothetical protein
VLHFTKFDIWDPFDAVVIPRKSDFSCFYIYMEWYVQPQRYSRCCGLLAELSQLLVIAMCTRTSYRDSWPLLLRYPDVNRVSTTCCSHGRSAYCYSSFLAAQTRCTYSHIQDEHRLSLGQHGIGTRVARPVREDQLVMSK